MRRIWCLFLILCLLIHVFNASHQPSGKYFCLFLSSHFCHFESFYSEKCHSAYGFIHISWMEKYEKYEKNKKNVYRKTHLIVIIIVIFKKIHEFCIWNIEIFMFHLKFGFYAAVGRRRNEYLYVYCLHNS